MMNLTDGGAKPTNPKDAVGIRKAPLSTLPATVLIDVALVLGTSVAALPVRVTLEAGLGMMEGARKYGRHNYRKTGVRASVYYDATLRHCMQWFRGEDIDPDSNLSHVTKAICSLVVLRDASIQPGMLTDDRPPPGAHYFDGMADAAITPFGAPVMASAAYAAIVTGLMRWWEAGGLEATQPHPLTVALARLFVLRAAMLSSRLTDDRPDVLPTGWLAPYNAAAGALIDKYPEEKPAITWQL